MFKREPPSYMTRLNYKHAEKTVYLAERLMGEPILPVHPHNCKGRSCDRDEPCTWNWQRCDCFPDCVPAHMRRYAHEDEVPPAELAEFYAILRRDRRARSGTLAASVSLQPRPTPGGYGGVRRRDAAVNTDLTGLADRLQPAGPQPSAAAVRAAKAGGQQPTAAAERGAAKAGAQQQAKKKRKRNPTTSHRSRARRLLRRKLHETCETANVIPAVGPLVRRPMPEQSTPVWMNTNAPR